jgi:hypothetical protein
MRSNDVIALLILFLIQLSGLRAGLMMILYKDALWMCHARNSHLDLRTEHKPDMWNPVLNGVGIFMIGGCLLLFLASIQVFLG